MNENNWIIQIGSDWVNYGLTIGKYKNQGIKAVTFHSFNGSTAGKPKVENISNWHPYPTIVNEEKVPVKIALKILKKWKENLKENA